MKDSWRAFALQTSLHEEHVRLAKTPKQAAEMGRQRNRPPRADWEQIKDDVMREDS
jgi:predicted NAD-dependent protein-ADP-ribosyltransferase YbiA (DUF1768 family)